MKVTRCERIPITEAYSIHPAEYNGDCLVSEAEMAGSGKLFGSSFRCLWIYVNGLRVVFPRDLGIRVVGGFA